MSKRVFQLIFFNSLMFLSACNLTGVKPDAEPEQEQLDLLEVSRLAEEAYANEDLVNGEKYYEILVKQLPQEAIHWYRLGNIYVRTNRPYASMNLYREAVLRDPKFAKAWYNLSVVQLKQTAFSLNEMLLYTDVGDPLYSKAERMLNQITDIISVE